MRNRKTLCGVFLFIHAFLSFELYADSETDRRAFAYYLEFRHLVSNHGGHYARAEAAFRRLHPTTVWPFYAYQVQSRYLLLNALSPLTTEAARNNTSLRLPEDLKTELIDLSRLSFHGKYRYATLSALVLGNLLYMNPKDQEIAQALEDLFTRAERESDSERAIEIKLVILDRLVSVFSKAPTLKIFLCPAIRRALFSSLAIDFAGPYSHHWPAYRWGFEGPFFGEPLQSDGMRRLSLFQDILCRKNLSSLRRQQ